LTVYYFIYKKFKKNFLSCLPLLLAATVFLLIRGSILGVGVDNGIISEIMNNPFLHATTSEKYATIFFTLWMYMKLLFFPHPLTYDYYPKQIPIIGWNDPGAFLPFLFYLAIGIYALYGLIKKRDVISYSIWFYLLPLSVVSNIFFPVGTFMNERFLFISSIGFCIFIGWLIYNYIPKLFKNPQYANYFTSFITIVILSLYSVKTISRNRAWENDLTLFTTDVKISVNSAKSNCSAGGKLLEEAQRPNIRKDKQKHDKLCEESLKYLNRAIEIYPQYIDALNLLGNAYFEYNYQVARSLHFYAEVLELRPYHLISYENCRIVAKNAIALINNNTISSDSNNVKEILSSCEEVLKTSPDMGEIYHLEGLLYGRYLNDLKKALDCFEKANLLNNFVKTADFYKDIGVVYGLSSDYGNALINFLKAVELDPDDPQTYINIGVTYQNLGDTNNGELYIRKGSEMMQNMKKDD